MVHLTPRKLLFKFPPGGLAESRFLEHSEIVINAIGVAMALE